MLALDLGGRLAVALAALRQPVEAHRLAQATETGAKLPGLQYCVPWIAAGTTGTSSWSATIAAPGCALPGDAVALARALDEEPERLAVARRPGASAAPLRGRTRRGAPRSSRSRRISCPSPGTRCASILARKSMLRGDALPKTGDVDPVQVVERDHDPAFGAARAPRRRRAAASTTRRRADPIVSRPIVQATSATFMPAALVRGRAPRSARRRRRPSRSVVSICSASSAGASAPRRARRAAAGRWRARRRRCPGRSATAAGARASPVGDEYTFTSASRRDDRADVASLDHDVAVARRARAAARASPRAPAGGARRRDHLVDRATRGSRPSRRCRRSDTCRSSSKPTGCSRASAPRPRASPRSARACSASHVSARYIAPVSR